MDSLIYQNNKTTGVRVLFTGQYWPGANTLYIARAFEQCGAIVRLINDTAIFPEWTGVRGRIARRLLWQKVIESEWNRQFLEMADKFAPDLIYLSNANFCWPDTLRAIKQKGIPLMAFYHDVIWNNLKNGGMFSKNIAYFDLVATTRGWQEPEFKEAGAKKVAVVRFGYDPLVHRPLKLSPLALTRYEADVTFIGTKETHRSRELDTLVDSNFPYNFRLWGGYWNQLPPNAKVRKYWQGRHIHEQEIPVIYAASKVALHWVGWEPQGENQALKKGDQHNSRTFQIAACGGAMMLAQRTGEHLRFFTEDVEAVYFDDVKELREKLGYWLDPSRDEARRQIAAAARARCLNEDYSYVPVVRKYLKFFGLPEVSRPITQKTRG